jgi:uncharacterized membrane protein
MPLLAYLLFCLLAGIIGSNSKLGFWGFFFLSVFTTPLVGVVVAVMGSPSQEKRT